MYKIIGADGKAYGPVNAEQLRAWIAEGRANGQTLAQVEGATDWKPLSALPEFAVTSVPPTLAPAPAITAAPAPAPSAPVVSGYPAKNSPMAVAGFVCSLLGLMCCGPLFSSLGLIFSIIGLGEIKRHPQQFTGNNLAIAGIVLGALGLVMFAAIFLGGLGADLFHGLRRQHRFML